MIENKLIDNAAPDVQVETLLADFERQLHLWNSTASEAEVIAENLCRLSREMRFRFVLHAANARQLDAAISLFDQAILLLSSADDDQIRRYLSAIEGRHKALSSGVDNPSDRLGLG